MSGGCRRGGGRALTHKGMDGGREEKRGTEGCRRWGKGEGIRGEGREMQGKGERGRGSRMQGLESADTSRMKIWCNLLQILLPAVSWSLIQHVISRHWMLSSCKCLPVIHIKLDVLGLAAVCVNLRVYFTTSNGCPDNCFC